MIGAVRARGVLRLISVGRSNGLDAGPDLAGEGLEGADHVVGIAVARFHDHVTHAEGPEGVRSAALRRRFGPFHARLGAQLRPLRGWLSVSLLQPSCFVSSHGVFGCSSLSSCEYATWYAYYFSLSLYGM